MPRSPEVCLDITGLDAETLKFLRDCQEVYGFNKVEAGSQKAPVPCGSGVAAHDPEFGDT